MKAEKDCSNIVNCERAGIVAARCPVLENEPEY